MGSRRQSWREVLVATLVASTLSSVCLAQPPAAADGTSPAPPPGADAGLLPPPGDGRGPGRRGPGFDDMLERNAERLGLDDQTRAEIRRIADAAQEESRSAEERLRGLHEEMRRLLDQPAPELEAVLHQADLVGAAETELHKVRLRTMVRIRSLLTPEQRAELVRIHQEWRRQRGPGGPPWPPPGARPVPPPDGR